MTLVDVSAPDITVEAIRSELKEKIVKKVIPAEFLDGKRNLNVYYYYFMFYYII